MRDDEFLEEMLYELWENHFCDVPRQNLVVIKFGKYSKRQLGSIKLAREGTKIKGLMKKREDELHAQDIQSVTVITITRYFQHDIVPEFIIRSTIAHELCHYTHGFHSPLQKQFDHPHQGNVINKELAKRDLLEEQVKADIWLKENWLNIVNKRF